MKRQNHLFVFLYIAFIVLILLYFNPLALDLKQNCLFCSLVIAVIIWATNLFDKMWTSIALLIAFIVFGKTPALTIFAFMWQPTALLIMTTTLLSVGILQSGIFDGFLATIFNRYIKNLWSMMLFPYLIGFVFIFIIPQAFARVIIIGSIYHSLLSASNDLEEKTKQALLFHAFFAIVVTCIGFSNGDIVLNKSAIDFSGSAVVKQLTFFNWLKWNLPPTILAAILIGGATYLTFYKELKNFHVGMLQKLETHHPLKKKQRITLLLAMLIMIVAWMTESIHGVPAWTFALITVLLMYSFKILKWKDLKQVNLKFMIFLMTVFSIGRVLGQAGVTKNIFNILTQFIPSPQSPFYLLMIALLIMVLHLAIGSSVATLSVVLPILVPLAQRNQINGAVITLISYIIVDAHYLFPFHHATLLIGIGKKYYPETYMFRMGLMMSVIVLVIIFAIFLPWWRLTGLI